MKEEVIKEVLDHFINIIELDIITKAKERAVKQQDFAEAASLRDKEVVLIGKLPSLEQIKELRNKL